MVEWGELWGLGGSCGMEIPEEQYQQVDHLFPVPRGNVNLSNLQVLNAVLYLAEQGCKWQGLPEHWDVPALNSASVKGYPDATGAPKKRGRKP